MEPYRVAPVPKTLPDHDEGAPGLSLLKTGEGLSSRQVTRPKPGNASSITNRGCPVQAPLGRESDYLKLSISLLRIDQRA